MTNVRRGQEVFEEGSTIDRLVKLITVFASWDYLDQNFAVAVSGEPDGSDTFIFDTSTHRVNSNATVVHTHKRRKTAAFKILFDFCFYKTKLI